MAISTSPSFIDDILKFCEQSGMSTKLSLHITAAHTGSCKTVRFKLFVSVPGYL